MRSGQQRDSEKAHFVETKPIYQGVMIQLEEEIYQFEDRKKVFQIIRHPGAVVMIPIDPEGRLLLIKQWRRAAREITIELPAGTLEKGEEPLECAKRELQEETGYQGKKFTPLGGFFTAPSYCTEFLHFFLAEDLILSPLEPDDDEMIDLLPVTLKEAQAMIENNEIRDIKTIAGILRYLLCVKV